MRNVRRQTNESELSKRFEERLLGDTPLIINIYDTNKEFITQLKR